MPRQRPDSEPTNFPKSVEKFSVFRKALGGVSARAFLESQEVLQAVQRHPSAAQDGNTELIPDSGPHVRAINTEGAQILQLPIRANNDEVA